MKNLVLIIAFIAHSLILFAADLVVQDGGPTGTYSTISAAVAAAVDGDRIVINNTSTGLARNENVTINKSLTLLSAVDNQRHLVLGNYTIEHAPGREVTIIRRFERW